MEKEQNFQLTFQIGKRGINVNQKSLNDSLKILTLIRLDAQRVFERVKYREPEYMHYFSAKRTREHFPEVFKNRYYEMRIQDLLDCGEEVLIGLDQFYTVVDDLKWYLMVTEDMPGTVQEHVTHAIREMEEAYELLQLYINAELESLRPAPPSLPPQDLDTPDFSE